MTKTLVVRISKNEKSNYDERELRCLDLNGELYYFDCNDKSFINVVGEYTTIVLDNIDKSIDPINILSNIKNHKSKVKTLVLVDSHKNENNEWKSISEKRILSMFE